MTIARLLAFVLIYQQITRAYDYIFAKVFLWLANSIHLHIVSR